MVRNNSIRGFRGVGWQRLWHDLGVRSAFVVVFALLSDVISWIGLALRSQRSREAEILFLRRQLALYVERRVRPRRIDVATRVSLALLSRLFEWRSALVVVGPETLLRWHRAAFRVSARSSFAE